MALQHGLQPPDATGRWIEHNAPGIDPAWALSEAIKQRSLPPASPVLQKRRERFVAYMNGFLARSNDKAASTAFHNCTTWEHVRVEAERALDDYANQGTTWRNPFRRARRLVGSMACRIEFLTVLIPSGDYLGPLCGGLTLVYKAAIKKAELRELIMGSLQALEVEIDHAKTYVLEYAWNDDLRKTTDHLYVAILDAVEEITKWIENSKGVRGFVYEPVKALVQQDQYGRKLQAAVAENVKDKVEAFDRVVRMCLHTEVRDTAKNVVTAGRLLEAVHGQITGQTGDLKLMTAAVSTLEDKLRQMVKDQQAWLERQRIEDERRKEDDAIKEQRLLQIYQATLVSMAASTQQPPQATLKPSQLLSVLHLTDYDPSHDVMDTAIDRIGTEREFVLYFGRTMSARHQSRLSTAMADPRFQEWFKDSRSRTLVISGMDMDAVQSDVVSPLSYMCAILARTVAEAQYAKPLAFFCRLHADPDDRLCGAAGMMRSLVAQFVLFHAEDPGLLSTLRAEDLRTIEEGHLWTLLDLFGRLIQSVAPGVTICMVDGVSFFEKEIHIEGMHYAMQYLGNCVDQLAVGGGGHVLKLLVTSATTSENFRSWFPNGIEMFMPGEFLLGGPGFNEFGLLM